MKWPVLLVSLLVVLSACDRAQKVEARTFSKPSDISAVSVDMGLSEPHTYGGDEYPVANINDLYQALSKINQSEGFAQVILEDGVYTLHQTLHVAKPHVVIRSKSGNRKNVIIEGDMMGPGAAVSNLLWVTASHFKIDGVTLRKAGNHLIQVAGEMNADAPEIRNCILQDSFEQMIKISGASSSDTSEKGIIEHCIFEYTAGIGPQFYIGGIDGHQVQHYLIRNNLFINIASPSEKVAEHAVHFWSGADHNIVENNVIIDCDRGIGFGMWGPGKPNNVGGIIRNNFIHHTGNPAHKFADVGIALEISNDVEVYNNTVLIESSFPWAIEYRWDTTKNNRIYNNVSNKPIKARNGGEAQLSHNFEQAKANMFSLKGPGDLHLKAPVEGISALGLAINPPLDIDGDVRDQHPDLGADEL